MSRGGPARPLRAKAGGNGGDTPALVLRGGANQGGEGMWMLERDGEVIYPNPVAWQEWPVLEQIQEDIGLRGELIIRTAVEVTLFEALEEI